MISVLLENIRSLHNVGSVFRTADGAGVGKIYLTGVTASPPHKDIAKTALGAENSAEWQYFAQPSGGVEAFLRSCDKSGMKPLVVIAETDDAAKEVGKSAQNYTEVEIPENAHVLIILGNEKEGVSQESLENADLIVKIPMRGEKESLNVAIAAGILMYEFTKETR